MRTNSGSKSPKKNEDEILKEFLYIRDQLKKVAENPEYKYFSSSREEICEGIDCLLIKVCHTLIEHDPERLDKEEKKESSTIVRLINNFSKG